MGHGASSHVKTISINQQALEDEGPSRRRPRSNPGSAAIRAVGDRLRRGSAERARSADKIQQLRNAIQVAEKKVTDAEARVRTLEREVTTLELRNGELADEVTWLRQQLSDRPEVPIAPRTMPPRPPSLVATAKQSSTDSVVLPAKTIRPDSKGGGRDEELAKTNNRLNAELDTAKRSLATTRAQLLDQINGLEAQVKLLLKSNSTTPFESSTSSPVPAEPTNEPTDCLSSSIASQAFGNRPHMTHLIQTQKQKIRNLEEKILKRDLEIGQLKRTIDGAAGHQRQSAAPSRLKDEDPNNSEDDDEPIPAVSSDHRFSRDECNEIEIDNQYNNNVVAYHHNKTVVRDQKNDHENRVLTVDNRDSPKLSVDSRLTERRNSANSFAARKPTANGRIAAVEDEIEALLTDGSDRKSQSENQPPKSNQTTVMVELHAKPSTPMKNLYALSEQMEPVKVVDSGKYDSRPQTACDSPSASMDRTRLTSALNEQTMSASVPMLFQTNKPVECSKHDKRTIMHRRRRFKRVSHSEDAELMSIKGEPDSPKATVQSTNRMTPINQSAWSTDDDDADQLADLNRQSSQSTSSRPRPGTSAGSTKSRDSGVVISREDMDRFNE